MKKVEWSKTARKSLDKYCDYLAEESEAAAKKVRKELVLSAKKLCENPELYQLDEYYPENPGTIRRFFRWQYRVVYQVREKKVIILDVIHTSKKPNLIK